MIYLDNNSTTRMSDSVRERLHEVVDSDLGNPESPHSDGNLAREIIEESRWILAESLNSQIDQVIFTGSGSESNSFAINELMRRNENQGSLKVLTSKLEHSSLSAGFRFLESMGAQVIHIPINKQGIVDLDALRSEAKKGVDAFVFQYANGITGIIQPLKEIATLAQEFEAYCHVDAAQAYGRFPIDFDSYSFNSLTVTAHKIHGPKGVAALFLRNTKDLTPSIFGGQQEQGLRGGTHNVLGIAGFGQAVKDRFNNLKISMETLAERRELFERLIRNTIPSVVIRGMNLKRVANTSSITFTDKDGLAFMMALNNRGVICSQSSACQSRTPGPNPALTAMGLSKDEAYSTLRFSMSIFTTSKEIENAAEIIYQTYRRFSKRERASA